MLANLLQSPCSPVAFELVSPKTGTRSVTSHSQFFSCISSVLSGNECSMFVKLQTRYYLHTQKATLTLYTKLCQNLADFKQIFRISSTNSHTVGAGQQFDCKLMQGLGRDMSRTQPVGNQLSRVLSCNVTSCGEVSLIVTDWDWLQCVSSLFASMIEMWLPAKTCECVWEQLQFLWVRLQLFGDGFPPTKRPEPLPVVEGVSHSGERLVTGTTSNCSKCSKGHRQHKHRSGTRWIH